MTSPLRRHSGHAHARLATLALGVCLALPGTGAAQMLPLTVPKGQVRFDLGGEFRNWDQRWRDGTRENLAADWVQASLGSDFLGPLTGSEARIAQIIGAAFRFDLGKSGANSLVNVGTLRLGLAWGVTSRITIFGSLPIVRVRVQPTFTLDGATANSGFNPASEQFGTAQGQAAAALFFSQFTQALSDLDARIQSGTYDGTGQRALAEQTLAQGQALRTGLQALLLDPATASSFLPLGASTGGLALTGTVTALQSILNGTLGVAGFSALPPLPTQALTAADFNNFVTNQAGPVAGLPLSPVPVLFRPGDAEAGVALLLIDRKPRRDGGLGLRLAAQGLARLSTAVPDNARRFFDVGTGDWNFDLDVRGVADLAWGDVGARLSGGYVRQFAKDQTRRITPLGQPIGFANTEATLTWDPGDLVTFRAQPFLRLAPSLALHTGVAFTDRGEDSYSFRQGEIPAGFPDPTLLNAGTAWTTTSFSAGLSYSHDGVDRRGRRKLPMDAHLEYERILSASGGRVPDARVLRMGIRLYGKPF